MTVPQPPYTRDERHPYIQSSEPDRDSGYEYCVICGVAAREFGLHIPDQEIEAHTFRPYWAGPYSDKLGWRMPCASCGYFRVNMKHPAERPRLCGAQISLDFSEQEVQDTGFKMPRAIAALCVVRCDVDIEHAPRHTHHASVPAFTIDAHAQQVAVTWSHS